MRRYLMTQWLQRIVYGGSIIAILALLGFLSWYLLSKPTRSAIVLTDYSKITLEDTNCNHINLTGDSFLDQFPISLSYKTNDVHLSLSTDTDSYNATLQIVNSKQVYVTIGNYGDDSPQTYELPQNQSIVLKIRAIDFDWYSSIDPGSFDDIKETLPEYDPWTSDGVWGSDENPYEYTRDEFEFPENPDIDYQLGLCGKNVAFLPQSEAATLDDLYSMGINVVPDRNETIALEMNFSNLVSIQSKAQSLPVGDWATVRIILNRPTDDNLWTDNPSTTNVIPSVQMVVVGLSDDKLIFYGDSGTYSYPGLITHFYEDEIESSSRLEYLTVASQRVFIDSPRGYYYSDFPKVSIPEDADQLIIDATFNPVKFEFIDFRSGPEKNEITGKRIGSLLDGKEIFPSHWERIPSDLQVALITVLVPVLATLIGYAINKRASLNKFFDWLFSVPRYTPPVTLNPDAHIFHLFSGAKLSGIIDRVEGRSSYRLFVLKDARKWDSDHWSIVLSGEVRIPQTQIEMYYKNQP